MNVIRNTSDLLGRVLLVALYVWSGVSKLGNFGFFEKYSAAHGVPASLLGVSVVVELGGSLLLLVGYQTRLAALALAGYTIVAVLLFYGIHPAGMPSQIIAFAEVAAAGGFLMLLAHGAGDWSLDHWLGRRGGRNAARPAIPAHQA